MDPVSITKKEITTEELLIEFKELYVKANNQVTPLDTEAIVILGAGGIGQKDEENISRVKYAGRILETLGRDVPVVFSGVTEESKSAPELMIRLGIPQKLVIFQDCGPRGVANTKDQFEVFCSDKRTENIKKLILVTSSYHIPRVKRTAGKLFPVGMEFSVLADLNDFTLFNVYLKVIGEIERILKYSAKGDILAKPLK